MLRDVKSTVTIYSSRHDASGDNSAAYDYVESVNSQGGDLKCKFSEVQMGTVSFDLTTAGTGYADKTKAIGHEYGSLPVPEKTDMILSAGVRVLTAIILLLHLTG